MSPVSPRSGTRLARRTLAAGDPLLAKYAGAVGYRRSPEAKPRTHPLVSVRVGSCCGQPWWSALSLFVPNCRHGRVAIRHGIGSELWHGSLIVQFRPATRVTRTTLTLLTRSSGSLSLMPVRTLLVTKSVRQDFSHPNHRGPVPLIAAHHLIRRNIQAYPLPTHTPVDVLKHYSAMRSSRLR